MSHRKCPAGCLKPSRLRIVPTETQRTSVCEPHVRCCERRAEKLGPLIEPRCRGTSLDVAAVNVPACWIPGRSAHARKRPGPKVACVRLGVAALWSRGRRWSPSPASPGSPSSASRGSASCGARSTRPLPTTVYSQWSATRHHSTRLTTGAAPASPSGAVRCAANERQRLRRTRRDVAAASLAGFVALQPDRGCGGASRVDRTSDRLTRLT